MHYCLNREELRQLIEFKFSSKEISTDELQIRIGNAESWQDELGALTYLFSLVLERKVHAGEECAGLIGLLYQLVEDMYLYIQECDSTFIDYMLRNVRRASLTLEEELVELQNGMSEYKYAQTLRY